MKRCPKFLQDYRTALSVGCEAFLSPLSDNK